MNWKFLKKLLAVFTINFSLLLTPELMAAVNAHDQGQAIQNFVNQYNKNIKTLGDLQKLTQEELSPGSLNLPMAKENEMTALPRLQYKDGKILAPFAGDNLEIGNDSGRFFLKYEGKKVILEGSHFNVVQMRPVLNLMMVNLLNKGEVGEKFLDKVSAANKEKLAVKKARLFSATDDFISFKIAPDKEVLLKLMSETEVEMTAFGKSVTFNTKSSPLEIESIIKKEYLDAKEAEKVTLNKMMSYFIQSASAGIFEDASNFYDKNGFVILGAAAITALIVALPATVGFLAMLLLYYSILFVGDFLIGKTLQYAKKREILKMINDCANKPDSFDNKTASASKADAKSIADYVSLESALEKLDAFKKICSDDSACLINNSLEKCKEKTIRLYKSMDNAKRNRAKATDDSLEIQAEHGTNKQR